LPQHAHVHGQDIGAIVINLREVAVLIAESATDIDQLPAARRGDDIGGTRRRGNVEAAEGNGAASIAEAHSGIGTPPVVGGMLKSAILIAAARHPMARVLVVPQQKLFAHPVLGRVASS
jgi:hypothetical protein